MRRLLEKAQERITGKLMLVKPAGQDITPHQLVILPANYTANNVDKTIENALYEADLKGQY